MHHNFEMGRIARMNKFLFSFRINSVNMLTSVEHVIRLNNKKVQVRCIHDHFLRKNRLVLTNIMNPYLYSDWECEGDGHFT